MALLIFKFIIAIMMIYHELIPIGGTYRLQKIFEGTQHSWGACSESDSYNSIMRYKNMHKTAYMTTLDCSDHEWIINWDADDLGKKEGRRNCLPTPPSQTFADCSTCLCGSDPYPVNDCVDRDGFYWGQRESNVDKNRVITGVSILENYNYIIVETQHATLLSNGKVDRYESWGSAYLPTAKYVCNYFSNSLRTVFLDEIVLPAKYVVTGIRIALIEKSAGRKGWKLEVKGTEYDSSFILKKGTDQWFDHTNHVNNDISYKRIRTEIPLKNYNDITFSREIERIKDTNHYVRIRAANFASHGYVTVPYFGRLPELEVDNLPLQGVGLSFAGDPSSGGIVYLKRIPHKSLILSPTERPSKTTTEITTKPPVKSKIISIIKLRTTSTMKSTSSSSSSTNVFTVSPPTVQPLVKRLRNQPVNISCSSTSEIYSPEGKSVDISDELFILLTENGNSGTKLLCQLFLISTLFLFVVL